MNRLPVPTFFHDRAAFRALAYNPQVGSYPKLQTHVAAIRAGYIQYRAVRGDATAVAPIALPDDISELLRNHYAKPPKSIGYIKTIRQKSGVLTCPMCGAPGCGTLDHVLPKATHAAFAVFGLNLVPACKCNSLRSTTLTGPNPGERVLHPYFDKVLARRLVVARFDDLCPVPRVTLRLLLPATHCRYAAVRFHLENVVMRTQVLDHLHRRWVSLLRRPGSLTVLLRSNPKKLKELEKILIDERDRLDDHHDSRNNWDSVFVNGLLDDHVLLWLFAAFNSPGRRPNGPLV